mmetsp:Transcript_36233/g.80635  ORF Transcript_36233/g.80635 Transcript_36233/m.80635 type:complete len:251 (+) Transcript_36233:138-890(+)|eukprot:CAMPEP_0202890146 /NCGR_PEP_ID=MMETSP1392-20130828/652_1 /ASSEMBLY_ACC=CAM_ASM_000868 /TAXON_ID=225041 /ORGANISM="Chlamydomonas chlamydogama, Strain SAG 11-48b" /LENGTH=250 /DNA_ID=CAMNT_0049573665 /DNA_START=135 /DNA_END=887 /DNA_ORIENTATION=+
MGDSITLPGVGTISFKQKQKELQDWVKQQHPAVEVIIHSIQAAVPSVLIGYLLGSLGSMDPNAAAMNPQLAAMQAGGPWAQARNFGVLTGVNAGLGLTIKKMRNGKEDVWGSMGAAFGAGACYSLVSGQPNPLQAAVTSGMVFALFNGLIYQAGQMFKPEHEDSEYERGKYMLKTLGLTKYQSNLQKGLLTDNTIMLWNESALTEARIPPGPRLLILHHLDQYRNPANVLKPALPLPPLPPQPVAAQQAR